MEHLINPDWFVGMKSWVLLLIGAVAMAAIIKGADWLVEGASGMALRAGISKIVIGATIVSLGTTSPECAVSVMAAWGGDAGLALGNAVGSIIADTGLIFGVGCLLMALPVDRFILNRQGWVQFGAAVLLAAVCYVAWWLMGDTAEIGRWIGLLFLGLLAAYLIASVRWGQQHAKLHAGAEPESDTDEILQKAARVSWVNLIVRFIFGLALVITFGQVLVNCAAELCVRWGVPDVVVASTIIALGTSLPELVVGITAIRKGHAELLIGNVIGADVLNVLFVIGASASAKPLPIINAEAAIPAIFLYLQLPTMLVILTLFRLYIFAAVRRGRFLRWFGVPLVAIYIAFLVMNYVLEVRG